MSKSDSGKGDSPRPVGKEFYKNGERLFGPSRLNLWPRDTNGNLIEEDENNDIKKTTGP